MAQGRPSTPAAKKKPNPPRAQSATTRAAAPSRRPPTKPPAHDESYWGMSMRPLHVLIFLLPLVVLYEVGSALYLTDGSHAHGATSETIKAYRLLGDFFTIFGAAGIYMPGIALVTVLVVWHLLSRDPWKIRWNFIAGMTAESVAWTLPLIVLSAITTKLAARAAFDAGAFSALAQGDPAGAAELASLAWQAKLAVAIGAGLYEEVLFRFVGIALLHFVLKDLLGARELASSIIAVVGSAVAFALYHDIAVNQGAFDWVRFTFLTLAGIYLGAVYVLRGFGIVVGTHALYDVVVLVLLTPSITAT